MNTPNQANPAAPQPGMPSSGMPPPLAGRPAPNPSASGGIQRAGFGRRALAMFIDGMVLTVVQLPLQALDFLTLSSHPSPKKVMALFVIKFIVSISLSLSYAGVLLSKKGATWGKMAMQLRVLDTRTGQYPTFGQAASREMAKFLSLAILCIGYLLVLFRSDKRALHDLMLNTVVIKVK